MFSYTLLRVCVIAVNCIHGLLKIFLNLLMLPLFMVNCVTQVFSLLTHGKILKHVIVDDQIYFLVISTWIATAHVYEILAYVFNNPSILENMLNRGNLIAIVYVSVLMLFQNSFTLACGCFITNILHLGYMVKRVQRIIESQSHHKENTEYDHNFILENIYCLLSVPHMACFILSLSFFWQRRPLLFWISLLMCYGCDILAWSKRSISPAMISIKVISSYERIHLRHIEPNGNLQLSHMALIWKIWSLKCLFVFVAAVIDMVFIFSGRFLAFFLLRVEKMRNWWLLTTASDELDILENITKYQNTNTLLGYIRNLMTRVYNQSPNESICTVIVTVIENIGLFLLGGLTMDIMTGESTDGHVIQGAVFKEPNSWALPLYLTNSMFRIVKNIYIELRTNDLKNSKRKSNQVVHIIFIITRIYMIQILKLCTENICNKFDFF